MTLAIAATISFVVGSFIIAAFGRAILAALPYLFMAFAIIVASSKAMDSIASIVMLVSNLF